MASSAAYAYKPHVRQEGFHLPSPPHSTDTPPPHAHAHDGIFAMGHGFHAGDFNDELAGLINPQSNERSTQSPTGYEGSANGNNNNGNGSGGGGSDGGYRPPPHTHNIFDISAPSQHHANAHHHGSASSTSSSFPAHFSLPSAGGDGRGSPGGDAPQPAPQYHFNSTLPALNSSMRYDPHPPPGYMPSPSSFRSPSPHHTSRSRSRSRPPSSHLASNPTSGPGPTRTTRTRRNGSLSSTSPPPRPVPQAIVIPGSHGANNGARGSPYGAGWFGVNGDYPHATPDSLPSLTSLPSLNSLGSYSSHHLGSPHLNPHSPHLNSPHHGLGSGSPHPFAINGGGMYANNTGSYGSPVEAKFGGMGLHGGHHGGYGGMGSLGPANIGLPSSLGTNGLHGSGNGNGNGMSGSLTSSVGGTASLVEGNGNGNGNGNGKESKAESKATLLAHEKRRRRRESHNAVERRRRDNINEKISELATLIPECLLDGGGQGGQGQSPSSPDDALLSPTGPGAGAGDWPLVLPGAKKEMMDDDGKDGKEGAVVKANKGMILRKSVEYIRYLQQLVAAQGARNRELEEQLKGFRGSSGSASPPSLSLGSSAGLDMDALGAFGGGGGWQGGMLAPMPEGEDEELHELANGANGHGNGGGGGGGGGEMDVDGNGNGEGEEKRGRRAKRNGAGTTNGNGNGVESKGVGKGKSPTKRKAKKAVQEVDEEEEESELSEDGMDV